jgi:uncharacterized protein (DUF2062 family)
MNTTEELNVIRLVIDRPVPSLNTMLNMHWRARNKEKDAIQLATLLGLQAYAAKSVTSTIYTAESSGSLIASAIANLSAMIALRQSNSKSGRRKSRTRKTRKRSLK